MVNGEMVLRVAPKTIGTEIEFHHLGYATLIFFQESGHGILRQTCHCIAGVTRPVHEISLPRPARNRESVCLPDELLRESAA